MSCCTSSESGDSSAMLMHGMPSVPLPMVFVAFVIGATLGVVIGHKREMMMQEGWGGGKPWMRRGMHGHHHHGEGSPPCQEWHGDWPQMEATQ